MNSYDELIDIYFDKQLGKNEITLLNFNTKNNISVNIKGIIKLKFVEDDTYQNYCNCSNYSYNSEALIIKTKKNVECKNKYLISNKKRTYIKKIK
jgi:hypothetical protein